MHQMTSSICSNATEGDTKQLIDQRDGKLYWVAKLKDNQCWMTQNLALDLHEGEPLTSSLSDVANWTPQANEGTIPSTTELNTEVWPTVNTIVRSYNPGLYLYNTPTTTDKCPNSTIGLAGCTNNSWVSVKNGYPSNDPTMNILIDYFSNTYDAHYLSGNYYSWGAATAGQAQTLTDSASGQEAAQSICPKGWRLPLGTNVANSPQNFRTLTNAYRITSGTNDGTSDTNITKSPLYFVRSGNISGSLNYAGSHGYYWSSTADTSTNAYNLVFYTAKGVIPSNTNRRYYGFSIRCVAR